MKHIKFAFAVVVLAVAAAVQADYLYWMVGNPVAGETIGGDDYARLYANGAQIGADAYYYRSKLDGIYAVTDLASVAGLAENTPFFVEVFHSGDSEAFYTSDAVTYGSLSQYVRTSLDSASGASYWSATAVPEPTGGVLLLLGLSALALRRKESV